MSEACEEGERMGGVDMLDLPGGSGLVLRLSILSDFPVWPVHLRRKAGTSEASMVHDLLGKYFFSLSNFYFQPRHAPSLSQTWTCHGKHIIWLLAFHNYRQNSPIHYNKATAQTFCCSLAEPRSTENIPI